MFYMLRIKDYGALNKVECELRNYSSKKKHNVLLIMSNSMCFQFVHNFTSASFSDAPCVGSYTRTLKSWSNGVVSRALFTSTSRPSAEASAETSSSSDDEAEEYHSIIKDTERGRGNEKTRAWPWICICYRYIFTPKFENEISFTNI